MKAPANAVPITGMGAVSPIGVGLVAYRAALRRGDSGVGLLGFTHPRMKSSVAAACRGFDPETVMPAAELARVPRLVPMAIAAAREAAGQAGLLDAETGRVLPGLAGRTAVVLGTGGGGIDFTLTQAESVHHDRPTSLWTITNATHGNLAGEISIALGAKGPSQCVSTGCASSSDAVGVARDLLLSTRPGAPEIAIVVGADAHIRWETLSGMELLRVISTRDWRGEPERAHTASRPFDAERDGFVLGEGAWAVVMERRDVAARREATPLAHIRGYAATCDAYHRVRPDPEMTESIRAMHLAMEDAGLRPEEVGLAHLHGTATQMNDVVETRAVRAVFGDRADRLQCTSVKSMIGHPQGAGGLAALVATLAGLTESEPFVPPTINLHTPDPECDLDYTPNTAAPARSRTALVNCLAFGAKNSAIVVEAVR